MNYGNATDSRQHAGSDDIGASQPPQMFDSQFDEFQPVQIMQIRLEDELPEADQQEEEPLSGDRSKCSKELKREQSEPLKSSELPFSEILKLLW